MASSLSAGVCLQDLASQLRALREAATQQERLQPTSGSNVKAEEVLGLLAQMEPLPVTAEILRESGVGKEVNHKFLRAHHSAEVRDRSHALVLSWKAAVGVGASSSTSGTPVCNKTPERKEVQPEEEPKTPGTINEKKRQAASPPENSGNKKQKSCESHPGDSSSVPSNQDIAALFKELSDFEFKKKEKFKALAYKKVADTLSTHSKKITSGREAASLPGIGKESAKKIDQFLSTGSIERLEKYRRGEMD